MKGKHSIWKNKLVKTMFLLAVLSTAALFIGGAAAAGITPMENTTQIQNNVGKNPDTDTKTVDPSRLSKLGNSPTGEYTPAPATPAGSKAFLINEGYEGTWVQSADPDDPIPYYVPVDPNFGQWDIDGLCVASQSGYPALTHYWSQYNNDMYPLSHSGDYCAGMWWSDGSGGDYVQNEWLKTPVMDVSAYPVGLELSVWGIYDWYLAYYYGDHLDIEITDYTQVWYPIIDMAEQELGGAGYGGYGWNWNEAPIVVDLSTPISTYGLDLSTIQVAIHAWNEYGGTIIAIDCIDDFQITVPAASMHVEKQIYVPLGGGPAEYTLGLEDTFGDGWNGGYLDVYVNGNPLYLGLTLAYGTGPEYHTIAVADGDVIFIDYTYYWYAYENVWYLLDNFGNTLFYEQGSYDNYIHDQTVTVSLGGAVVDYTLGLEDTFGDGWNGGYLDVYVNSVLILAGCTVSTGYGPVYYTISVSDGDVIFVDYTYYSWAYENVWYLIDNFGNQLFYETGSYDNYIHDQTVTVSVPTGMWVDADTPEEAINEQICELVQFKLTVTNDGDYPLYAIYIYDAWEPSMEFVDATPYPSYWGTDYAYWWAPQIPDPMMPGESVEILVTMHVLGPHCSIDYNWLYAWANSDYEPYYVEDQDYAYIHCVDAYHIDVQKYVRTRAMAGEWTITLEDSYGDGWNGGFLDIYVNGNAVYTGLTLPNGAGPESHPIAVTDLDEIFVDYTPGSWAPENIWYLTDQDGNEIFYEIGDYDYNANDHTVIAQVGEWVENAAYAQGETAMFLVSITNDGMQPLTDIDVYDAFDDSLQFVNADPYPDDIQGLSNAGVPPTGSSQETSSEPQLMVKDNNPQQSTPSNAVVWDNGMIWGEGLLAAQYEPSYGELGTCADDFQFAATTEVNDIEWIGGFWNGYPAPFDWQITFYYDDGTGNTPGAVYAGPYTFAWADCNPVELLYGTTSYYSFSADLPTLSFTAGVKYWVAFQAFGVFPPQSGMAGHYDYTIMHEMKFKSAFFGYPDWVDGSYVFGTVYDLSFTLTYSEAPQYNLYWNFPGPLAPGETIDILIWLAVVGDIGSTDYNLAWVETAEGPSGSNDASVTIADLTPPVTTHAFSGTMGDNDWYVSDVTITLTATDDYSGVASTWINLDGAGFVQYTAPIVVSDAGDHDILYYSVDNYGNVEATNGPFAFKIDQTAPVTTHTLAGTMGLNDWYVSDVTITLAATDATSGVAGTYYKIDSGAWTLYAGPVVVSTDGQHQLYYNSTDKAGNQEATLGPFAFKMDKTAPNWINYTFVALNALKNKWQCTAEVEDPTSGIVLVEFFVDDVLVGNDTTAPYEFTFNGKAENNSQALATDAAGNTALSPIATSLVFNAQQYTQQFNNQQSTPSTPKLG